MRFCLFSTVAVCALSLCLADIVSAQGRGRTTTAAWLGLLRMESVQQEIELVDEQVEEIETLQSEMWSQMQERMSSIRNLDLDPAERRERFAALREEMQEQQEEYRVKIEEVLLPMQVKRLKELHFQSTARRRGGGAVGVLKNDELLEELGIDSEQKKELEAKAEEIRKEMEEEIKKLQKKAEEKLLSVLTPEQRKMYREKVGELFNFGDERDPGYRRADNRRGGERSQRARNPGRTSGRDS